MSHTQGEVPNQNTAHSVSGCAPAANLPCAMEGAEASRGLFSEQVGAPLQSNC